MSLLICVATDLEGAALFDRFVHDANVRIIRTGVGPVNAAHAVTASILSDKPSSIVVCGVGGAYPSSGLQVGDVVCASMEFYGDLGASSPTGFLDMRALGFPRFGVAGHDRGGRVAHRMALDHGQAVERLAVLDIALTATMYACTDRAFATGY